jgi:hypothetical protein
MRTLGMSGAAYTHVRYGQPSQTREPPVTQAQRPIYNEE